MSRIGFSLFKKTANKTSRPSRKETAIIVVVLAIVLASTSNNAQAVHNTSPSLFQLDGTIACTPSGAPNWGCIFDSNGNIANLFGGTAAAFLKDQLSVSNFKDNSVFVGSNKNFDPISVWGWGTGNNQAKDDLSNVYAYATVNPGNGHLLLYAGFERLSPSGASHVDIEFFQQKVSLATTPPCNTPPCSFTGARTAGDVIVSMDFLTGGTLGSLSIRTWDGTQYVLIESLSGVGCNAADTICGFNNALEIPTGPWQSFDQHGNVITLLPPNAFTDFGVDLTAELHTTPCISTVMGKTRSSPSFTSTLEDFAGPSRFAVCSANIQIKPDKVNEVGTPHTFTVTVNQAIGSFSSPAPDGTPVAVTLTNSNGATAVVSSNTCTAGTVSGKCTITFTSAEGGTVTGHASAVVTIGGIQFAVQTDGIAPNSGDAVKVFVDAFITIAPNAVNEVGRPHTFSVTVKQNAGDGLGFVNAPDGQRVAVTLTALNGAIVSGLVDNCATSGTSGGVCTVTFTSNSAGTVTGHASVTLNVRGVTLTRATDGTRRNSGDAVKRFVDAFITIAPNAVNEVGRPHTFTVIVKQNAGDGLGFVNAPDGTRVTVTLTDSNGAVHALIGDTCVTGTVAGSCTVTFTSNTAGTVTGHATTSLTVQGVLLTRSTDATGRNSGDAVKIFVDASITIAPNAVNEVRQPHTFTVTVKQNAGDGLSFVNAPDGTKVIVTLTDTNGAAHILLSDTCATSGTVAGTCTVTFTSNTAGIVTGHASVTFSVRGVSLTRETNGIGPNSGDAVKRFVDAFITIAPNAVNEVGRPHTFTVTVKQNSGDGLGFVNAPDGTIVTVTLSDANGAVHTLSSDTCATGTIGGSCHVVFTSNSAGLVTGHAVVTLTIQGRILSRATDGTFGNSGDAVKRFVDAFITIAPNAVNEVGKPHTFTVIVKQNAGDGLGFVNAPDGTKVTVTLTDTNGAVHILASDTCATGTLGGSCAVTFTSNSAGTVSGHATVSLTVQSVVLTRATDGSSRNSGDAVKVFVDAFITIAPNAVNEVGKLHTFSVAVKQNAGDGLSFVNAPDGTRVTVTLTDSNGAVHALIGDTCVTGTVAGSCTVTFTSNSAGTVTGHASVTLTVRGVPLARATDGTGRNSNDALKRFVDAFITIAPNAVNEVGQPHIFTVAVKQNIGDGLGFVNAPDGTVVTVTLTDANGAVHILSSDTCSTGTIGGSCRVTFTSNSAGTVTGHATTTFNVQGVTLTRSTNGLARNSPDAVKVFVDAFITIAPNAVNEVGRPHTFTVIVKQNAGDGLSFVNAPDGTRVTVTLTDSNGAVHALIGDTCVTGTVAGSCTVTFTSNTAGIVTGHASVTLDVRGVTLTRSTDGIGRNSGDATKRFIDAFITIAPNAVNEVGRPHTFTITVKQNSGDGLGFLNVPDGTLVAVTLTDANGAVHVLIGDTCSTGTTGGSCSVTFTSNSAGTVTGHATATITIQGLSIARSTSGTGRNSGDAVKIFVDAFITITPNAVNEVGKPHTFTVTVKQNAGDGLGFVNSPDGTVVTVTLTDANGAVHILSSDSCAAGTIGGSCTVTFTSNSAGTVTGHASVTFSVRGVTLTRSTDGSARNSADAVKIFVDAFITIAPNAVNEVGRPHTFTITVKQNAGDGLGFVNAPDGTVVTLTLTDANGAVHIISGNTCASGTIGGTCHVTFTSTSAGTVTGHATVGLTVRGVTLVRATDGTARNSGDAIKRFVDAFITIAPSAVNEVGKPHTFTVIVKQNSGDGAGFVNVPDGTLVSVTLTDTNGAVHVTSMDTCAIGTIAGSCSVVFTSNSAGTVTGHASVAITVQGVLLTRVTDGTSRNSADAVKVFVDAFITIAPNAVNEVGRPHTFTVIVKQNAGDGLGFVNAPDGTVVTVTLTDGNGAVHTLLSNTCVTGTIAGSCTVTFTSNTAGTVTGHATVSLTIRGVTLTRSTDGLSQNSRDAVKVFVDAFITIGPSAVNEVGKPHTFTVTVKQNAGDGLGFVNAPDGTIVTVTLTDANGAIDTVSSNTCATGTIGGSCSVTFTSNTAGTVTGHASVTLTVRGVALTRTTDGTGRNSSDAVKRFVDAFITIGPNAIDSVGETHTFTVTVKQNTGDGLGFVNAPDGTRVTVVLTDSAGALHILLSDTCASTGTLGGTCAVTFTSNTAGTVTGHATVTLTVQGVTLTRSTDGTSRNSVDAVKIFVAGTIRWLKVDNVGNPLGGATFQVCRIANFNSDTGGFDPITPECFTVLDNNSPDQDAVAGSFLLTGLRLGTYTIRETIPPPGFTADPTVATVSMTINSPNATVTNPFVDQRPILKVTFFGFTDTLRSTPSQCTTTCTVSQTTTVKLTIHNYGGAAAAIQSGSLSVTFANIGAGSVTCTPSCTLALTGIVPAGGDIDFTVIVQANNVPSGATITANLSAVTYTTSPSDGFTRIVDDTPAGIFLTIQAN